MNISDSDKQALLDGTALIPFKINIIQDGKIIKTLDENSIVDIDDEDFRYVNPESIVIGQFVAKKITGNLDRIYSEFSIEDTEIELEMGVKIEDTTTYYSLGNYLVTKPTTDDVKDKTHFEALDYAKKFNKTFDPSGITFPCTAGELAQYSCAKCGVELATTDFTNSDFQIDKNPFDSDVMYRYVMQRIGKLAYSWVRIGYDNKCYIDFEVPTKVTNDFNKVNGANYYDLDKKEKMYGPVNRVVIGMSNVEGENVTVEDTDSINKNGVCEIQIMDNELTYTPELRAKVSESAKKLFGLTYLPLEITTTGHPWWTGKELIEITTPDGDTYQTIPFDRTLTYSGHIKTKATSKADTVIETEYKNVPSMESEIRKTRIVVDKNEQKINAVVEKSTKQDQQISELTVSVGNIESKVDNKVDITEDKNSNNARIVFTNINQGPPVEIRIRPTSNDISYLYPSKNLYPSKLTYLKLRDLVFTNTKTNEVFRYTLPMDLWYLDENTYDEFILNYPNQECKIIQRVDWNNNQDKYKLDKEIIHTFDFPNLNLTEGDYEISLPGYDSAYMYIKLMIQNEYTKRFATKVELNSSITQLDNEINLKVEGLYSDAKKEIDKKADDEEVKDRFKTVDDNIKAQLALKVDKDDNDQIVSMINASANIIHLKSNRFIVDSDNLSIEENGKLTCTAGEIGNMKIEKNSFYLPITTNNKLSRDEMLKVVKIATGVYTPTEEEKKKLDNNGDGKINNLDAVIAVQRGATFNITEANPGRISFVSDTYNSAMVLYGGDDIAYNRFGLDGIEINTFPLDMSTQAIYSFNGKYQGNNYTLSGEETTSKLEIGKNIVKNLSCFGNYNDSEEYKSNPYLEYSLDNDKKEAELIISNGKGRIAAGYYPSGIDIVSSEYEAKYSKNFIELTNKQTNHVITIANDTIKIIDNNTKQEAEMYISPNGAKIILYQDDNNYTTIFPGGINLVLNGQAKTIQGDN